MNNAEKGDTPRKVDGKKYRSGYDKIQWDGDADVKGAPCSIHQVCLECGECGRASHGE